MDVSDSLFVPFEGGPPFGWLQRRFGLWPLSQPPRNGRRIACVVLAAWVPLLILAAAQGHAFGPRRSEAFLFDIAAYARYLISAPLLLEAETVCLPVLARIAREFGESGLIHAADRARYDALLTSTERRLTSPVADIVIVVLAYMQSLVMVQGINADLRPTWRGEVANGAVSLTLAGWWLALVSYPLYLTLLYGWLWRLLLWTRLLWRISRLNLRLLPTHPDHTVGLGFLRAALLVLPLLAFAIACVPAGAMANLVLYEGRPVLSFKIEVIVFVVFVVVLLLGPLTVFLGPIRRARLRGIFTYGSLAGAVGNQLEEKWVDEGHCHAGRDSLEVSDFSATTDLYQVTSNTEPMRLLPFDLKSVAPVIVATLLPFVPLLLLQIPAKQLLEALTKLVL
jgi:hypothetical protein